MVEVSQTLSECSFLERSFLRLLHVHGLDGKCNEMVAILVVVDLVQIPNQSVSVLSISCLMTQHLLLGMQCTTPHAKPFGEISSEGLINRKVSIACFCVERTYSQFRIRCGFSIPYHCDCDVLLIHTPESEYFPFPILIGILLLLPCS